jgi:hypothetical protein
MRNAVKAEDVFRARKAYLRKPSIRRSDRFQTLRRRYEERFPKRRLCFFERKVIFRGF